VISDDSFMLHVKQISVLEIQEKERQRIARDLHDSSLQNLTHLIHKVELSSLYIDRDPVKAKLELATIGKNLRKVIEDIRNNIFDLRPMSFDDLGIKETIEKMLLMINQDRHFKIETDIEDIKSNCDDSKDKVILLSIYRIIQECVQNSIKHSQGDIIKVSLKDKTDSYEIIIQDNGIGFNVNEAVKKDNHFGLSVIKERVSLLNGIIEIDTQKGTLIRIHIPQGVEG
ncbi:MAG: sensor histidine kinase, partial [Lachnospiraceae bacterium]|nr:sensor histidine kinase [Lachnospiraceae bacterium]